MSALRKKQMQDPIFREKSIANLKLAHARRHEFEQKRLEAIKQAALDGKMSRPMTEERKARQLANLNTKEAKEKMAKSKMKPVICITTGIKYESLLDASEKTGILFSSISSVCLGKRNSVYGNIFKYIDT